MKFLLAVTVLCAMALSGCASGPKLPPGSYVEGTVGYSKDTGATGNVVMHVPLSAKRRAALIRQQQTQRGSK